MKIHNTTNCLIIERDHCRGCFQCIDACPRGVLGKMHLPGHRHVHVDHAERCIGCFQCLKVCPEHTIHKRSEY